MSIHYNATDPHSIAALYACAEASPNTRGHWLDRLAAAYVAETCPNIVAAAAAVDGQRHGWPEHREAGRNGRRAVRA